MLRGGYGEGRVFSISGRHDTYQGPMTIYSTGDAYGLATGVANSETRRLIVMFYCYTAFGAWPGISPLGTCVSRGERHSRVLCWSDTPAIYA